jgi:hypothetical protein
MGCDITMLQDIECSGVNRFVKESLYLVAHFRLVATAPQLRKDIFHDILGFFLTDNTNSIDQQLWIQLLEDYFETHRGISFYG